MRTVHSAGTPSSVRVVGRYALFAEIASGGMASVHFGRLLGPVGFSRTVAIKRLHPHLARDPDFVTMFLEEARLAARIRHPNVVSTLDVVATKGELFLVMDYVQGESLARLLRAAATNDATAPLRIARSIVCGMLHGLHAAHEARDERGEPLGLVHRDISPQNTMVGVDGIARVLDFGIAKAAGRSQITRQGHFKGKIAYMAPEQFQGSVVDRRADIYAVAVVLWEILTGRRLFVAESDAAIVARVLSDDVAAPSSLEPKVGAALDAVVLKGISRDPALRFATAREMALAVEASGPLATPSEVGAWVEATASAVLAKRAQHLAELEQLHDLPSPSSSRSPERRAGDSGLAIIDLGADQDALPGLDNPENTSSITVPHYFEQWRRTKSRSRWWAVAGGLCALLLALMVWVGLTRPSAAGAGRPAAAAPAESQRAAAGPMTSMSASRQVGAPSAVPPLSAAPPITGPLPEANERATAAKYVNQRPIGSARTRLSPRPGCKPPYTVDAIGHRHYKRECL